MHSIGILCNQIDLIYAVGTEIVRSEYIEWNLKERSRKDGYHGRKINVSQKDDIFIMTLSGLMKSDLNLQMR